MSAPRYYPLMGVSAAERRWHQFGFTDARLTDAGKAPATRTPPNEKTRQAYRLGWSVYRSRSGTTQICDYPAERAR